MGADNTQDIATESTSSAASDAPTSSAEASLLNNIKSRYQGPQVNTDNFQLSGVTPEQQAEMDQLSYMERNPATGALSLTDYYPDVNNPVGVGSYSGSMIGSTTLFAPGGGLVPLGMMDARDKAIQDAAYSKAKEYDAFRKMYQAPTTKLVNIQPEISSEYNKMLQGYTQEAKKKYGSQWAKKLETDQNFLAKNKAFQDIAKYGDDIVSTRAELDELMKTGKFVMSEALKNTQTKLFNALDPDSPDFKKAGDFYRQYKADINFNQSLNDAVKQIVLNQTGKAWVDDNDPEYLASYEETVKNMTPDQKKFIEDTLLQQYQGSDMYKPEFIKDNVARFTNFEQKKRDVSVTKKNEPNDGSAFKYDLNNDFSDEPTSITAEVQKKASAGGGTYQSEVIGTDGITFKKPIQVVMPIGKDTYFTDVGLVPGKILVNRRVLLGDMVIIDVVDNPGQWNDGTPVTKMQEGDYKTRKESMVLGKYKEKDKDGVDVEKSFFVPTKKVENSLVKKWGKDKSVEMGVPVDESYRRVEKYNSKNKSSKSSAPSKKSIKKADLQSKASAAGYTVDEYTKLLKQNGVNIID